jgi:ribosome-binding protein aMBF1 (putative translation factor)
VQGPTHTRRMIQPAEGETRKSRKARTAPFQARYDGFLAKLISAREEAGLTQRDVAQQLGMFHSWISKTESGDRRLDVMELMLLADLYKKTPQHFLEGE